MQQQGFVHQVGDLGLWAIGSHAFVVGSSFLQSRNLLTIVYPILRKLMEEAGETVNLAMLDLSDYRPSAVHTADADFSTDWRQAADAYLWHRQSVSCPPER